MSDECLNSVEKIIVRLPLWAVTDSEGIRTRGLPGALRAFDSDRYGPFLDLFTRADIAEAYIHKASLPTWQAVVLATPTELCAAVLELECRGCYHVGIDCTGRQDGGGRFLTTRQFLALIEGAA